MKNKMKKTILTLALTVSVIVAFGQNIKKAIANGDLKKAQKWLNKGKDLDQLLIKTDADGNNYSLHPLEYAAYNQQYEIATFFIDNSEKFKLIKNYYNSAFSSTIHYNNIEFTNYMLALGVDINAYCNICHNAPAIAIALRYNHYDIYKLLLQKGAHLVNKGAGFDVINAAAECDSLPLLKHLVEVEKLNIESINYYGMTPLFAAFSAGQIKNAKYLISKGADISKKDLEGNTILYHASNYVTFKYADELLKEKNILAYPDDALQITILDDKELFDYYIANYKDRIKTKSKDGEDIFFGITYSETHKNDEYFLQTLKALKLTPKPDKANRKTAFDYAKKLKNKELVNLYKKYFDL